jgi:hypothetical protein
MQKIADHQDYKVPATIDDAAVLFEIAEALGDAVPHQQAPPGSDRLYPAEWPVSTLSR